MLFPYRKISNTNFHHRGFTMIEMVVVLIVMAIFATVIVSRYTAIANELMVETDALKASLRFAQIQSMNNDDANSPVIWGINFADANTYRLYKNKVDASSTMIPVKGSAGDPDTVACPKNCHKLQGNVQISSGVETTVNFDRWGRPLDGSGNLRTLDTIVKLTQSTEMSITITKNTGYIP